MTSKVQGNPSLEVYFRKKWPKKHVLITRNTSQRCRTRKSARPIKKMSQTWSKKAQKIDFFRWNRSLFSPRKPTIWGSITAKSDRKGDARSRTTHPGGLNPQNLAENRKNPLKKAPKNYRKKYFFEQKWALFCLFPHHTKVYYRKNRSKKQCSATVHSYCGSKPAKFGRKQQKPLKKWSKNHKKITQKNVFLTQEEGLFPWVQRRLEMYYSKIRPKKLRDFARIRWRRSPTSRFCRYESFPLVKIFTFSFEKSTKAPLFPPRGTFFPLSAASPRDVF